MKKEIKFIDKIKLGTIDNRPIYLSPPSWDCGWYWGFGYLGNSDCHYHVDGIAEKNQNLYDALKEHFGESLIVKDDKDIWVLAELFKTFYILKKTAELYHSGGAGITTNPLTEIIKNETDRRKINEEIMPLIFNEIHKILTKYS